MPRPGPRVPSASAPRPALRSRCAARGTAPMTTRLSPGPAAAGPAGQAGGAPLAVPAHVRRAGRRGFSSASPPTTISWTQALRRADGPLMSGELVAGAAAALDPAVGERGGEPVLCSPAGAVSGYQ